MKLIFILSQLSYILGNGEVFKTGLGQQRGESGTWQNRDLTFSNRVSFNNPRSRVAMLISRNENVKSQLLSCQRN